MDPSEAQRQFELAVDHQQAGRIGDAQPIYERILASFPNFPHVPHMLGVIMGQRGDWYLARRLIESSLLVQPQDADALANLAWALHNLGAHELAIQRCEQALSINAAHPRAWFTLGMALYKLARFEHALATLERALLLQPALAEALNFRGRSLHALARYEDALQSYDRAIELRPGVADVHNNRGSALAALGRQEDAMAAFRRALQLDPGFAEAQFNIGLGLQQADLLEEALESYEATLRLQPDYLDALVCRAHVLQLLQRTPYRALAGLDRVLAVRPEQVEALYVRAGILMRLRHHADALDNYDRAIALRPGFHQAHQGRANALHELGRLDEAAQAYRDAAEQGGDLRSAEFVLAALGKEAAPAIAPRDFVVDLFDQYADRFDEHLVGALQYRAHELLCRAVLQVRPAGAFDILDLGCGTGLCGPLLQPIARTLVGVDLSPRMLQSAAQRGVYASLAEDDIGSFLHKSAPRTFDVIAAADVFVYIGDLQAVFAGAAKAIRPGGHFGFTIENSDSEDFVLRPSRRYAHSTGYIRRLAAQHGFGVAIIEARTLRKEHNAELAGHVIVLQAS